MIAPNFFLPILNFFAVPVSDFTLHNPRKELISSSEPSASAMLELLEIAWSQPNLSKFFLNSFGVPTSALRVYSIILFFICKNYRENQTECDAAKTLCQFP